jgi:hypothetical protein
MSTWHRQIDDAASVAEVVSIARDFLATWTPPELARLPEECRPGKIRDESDIAELHARLAEEYRTTRASGDELTTLQVITSFMVRTSVRIAELGGDTSVPPTTASKGSDRAASGRG